ncbi:uncharacterized protein LOC115743510 isoform X2 [Rhodamnia argentea]|uniref:Uncharacterized protein LOC115743510 isoform X2 n=1 Tax=Rhodamnia argentea TaxID=178133 RepID=A0A8B8PHA0_9MYRT|nr:uncharacterized protein LOC115743510 isoform X2 [Rhodamnia argentea]
MSAQPSPLLACLRPTTTDDPRSTAAGKPNLTTSLYHTPLGLFSLTWSLNRVARTLQLRLSDPHAAPSSRRPSSLALSFDLHVKPFAFWNKRGSKNFSRAWVFWDLSRAKFGSGPGPVSGYYVSVVVDGEAVLLVGDRAKEAHARTKARRPERRAQALVLRRDHVIGHRTFATAARFGGRDRDISIDCTTNEDARLRFEVDGKRVLQVKGLKWKFRGCERVEVDGVPIQVSWDVYSWLFERFRNGHAVFMFRFDKLGLEEDVEEEEEGAGESSRNGDGLLWPQQRSWSFRTSGQEHQKMRKSMSRAAGRSYPSSATTSVSASSWSASSGGSNSVMEWATAAEEENETGNPAGFSLMVYAWKE